MSVLGLAFVCCLLPAALGNPPEERRHASQVVRRWIGLHDHRQELYFRADGKLLVLLYKTKLGPPNLWWTVKNTLYIKEMADEDAPGSVQKFSFLLKGERLVLAGPRSLFWSHDLTLIKKR